MENCAIVSSASWSYGCLERRHATKNASKKVKINALRPSLRMLDVDPLPFFFRRGVALLVCLGFDFISRQQW